MKYFRSLFIYRIRQICSRIIKNKENKKLPKTLRLNQLNLIRPNYNKPLQKNFFHPCTNNMYTCYWLPFSYYFCSFSPLFSLDTSKYQIFSAGDNICSFKKKISFLLSFIVFYINHFFMRNN